MKLIQNLTRETQLALQVKPTNLKNIEKIYKLLSNISMLIKFGKYSRLKLTLRRKKCTWFLPQHVVNQRTLAFGNILYISKLSKVALTVDFCKSFPAHCSDYTNIKMFMTVFYF